MGRALGRWLLAGFGVVLIGGAVDGVLESLSWTPGPGRFEFVLFGSMVLFGVLALAVACRSMLARRRRGAQRLRGGPQAPRPQPCESPERALMPALVLAAGAVAGFGGAASLMTTVRTVLFPVLSAHATDPMVRALAAFLARHRGQTRVHTESHLRAYLVWCRERGSSLTASEPSVW